jgi:hypothetical protein
VIIPTVSTIQTDLSSYPRKTLFADSQSTQITFAGVGDLLLSTNYSTNQVFFSVSSFTAAGYLALSGEAFSVYNRLISTISSGFVTVPQFSTGAISLSTNSFSNASTVNSSILGVSSYFVTKFDFLTGLINARATIVQLNDVTGNFQVSLSSFSTNYVSYIDYLSSSAGIVNQVSTTLFLSSISSVYLYGGTINNFSVGTIVYDPNDVSTLSTATNSRIISTASTLALQNQGNLLSTFSTVLGLGTLRYISSAQLISTTQGLGSIGYISTPQLTSTIEGLGTLGYVSTSYSDRLLQSTTLGINSYLGSYGYVSTQSLTSSLQSTTQGLTNSLGSLGYLSTPSLQSTTLGLYATFGQFYISTSGLNTIINSSIQGLGTLGYISTDQLVSSFNSLFTYNLISSPNLQSTIDNLGTIGYISTASMVSSIDGFRKSVINIRSSIAYVGSNNIGITMTQNPQGADAFLYFSTATLNFDTFSSFIQSTSLVTFDANVNLFFQGPNDASYNGVYYLTTYLYCGGTVPSATYTDTFLGINGSSNIYSKMITLNISTPFIQKNYISTYNLVHYVNNGDTVTDFYPGVSIYMSPVNSLFLTILNSGQ